MDEGVVELGMKKKELFQLIIVILLLTVFFDLSDYDNKLYQLFCDFIGRNSSCSPYFDIDYLSFMTVIGAFFAGWATYFSVIKSQENQRANEDLQVELKKDDLLPVITFRPETVCFNLLGNGMVQVEQFSVQNVGKGVAKKVTIRLFQEKTELANFSMYKDIPISDDYKNWIDETNPKELVCSKISNDMRGLAIIVSYFDVYGREHSTISEVVWKDKKFFNSKVEYYRYKDKH